MSDRSIDPASDAAPAEARATAGPRTDLRGLLLPQRVVFDLDGTLVDSLPALRVAVNLVLAELGRRPLSQVEVRGFVGEGLDRLLSQALAATGAALDLEPLRDRWLVVYRETLAEGTTAFPGAEDLLRDLRAAGCRLGLCTNKPQEPAEEILALLGWSELFDAVVGADQVPNRKPAPEHLQQTLAAMGEGRAAYVGDSATDVETARGAGVPVILLSHGYSRVDPADLGADAVVDRMDQVPAALARVRAR